MHAHQTLIKKSRLVAALCLGGALCLSAQTMQHRYSFSDTAGSSTFVDSVGTATGTLINTAALDGSQLQLDGLGSYGQLPAGLVSSNTQVTIELWGTFSPSNPVWTRTFAFGDQIAGQPNTALDYCHYAGGNYQNLNINTPGGGAYANNSAGINGQTNIHVTVIVSPPTMYYYNGSTLISTLNGTVPPLSGLNDINGLIGRGLYDTDPTLAGSIDEFRMYSGVLSPSSIALNDASGPNSILTNPGTIQSLSLTSPSSTLLINGNMALALSGNFTSVSNLNLLTYGGATFTSGNTNILTVNATNGIVHAAAVGSTTITATYSSVSTNLTITVVSFPASLTHRYSFTTDATDSIGGANGTLNGSASVSGAKLVLDGATGSFLDLPGGLLNLRTNAAITLEAWTTIDAANGTWARLFEFGDGNAGGSDLFCAPQIGGGFIHWGIAQNYGTVRILDQSQSWSGTTMHHTWIINPATAQLESYTNGVLEFAIQNAPSANSGIPTNVAWLGKSPFADPYLTGSIDEFRIYNGALTPQEIAMTELSGPNSTVRDPGTLNSISVPAKTVPAYSSLVAPTVLANYANVANFSLLPKVSAAAVNGLVLTSSDTNVLTFTGNGMYRTLHPGTVTVSATYQGKSASGTITVANLGQLAHRYSFTTDASDSVGTAHGVNNGNAQETGGSLVLDGTGGTYVSLPTNMIAGYDAVTVDSWVTLNAGGTWARLWFFGDNQANEFYLAPVTLSGNTHRISTGIRDGFNADDAPAWQNQTIHITSVFGNGSVELYSNGVPVRTFTGVLAGLNQVGPSLAWIGRSPYNDPFMNCNVDEFRIYKGRLSAEEVAATDILGPNQLLTTTATLSIAPSGANNVFSWPVAAAGFSLQTRANLAAGNWVTLTNAPAIVGGNWQITLPANGTSQLYRLWR